MFSYNDDDKWKQMFTLKEKQNLKNNKINTSKLNLFNKLSKIAFINFQDKIWKFQTSQTNSFSLYRDVYGKKTVSQQMFWRLSLINQNIHC